MSAFTEDKVQQTHEISWREAHDKYCIIAIELELQKNSLDSDMIDRDVLLVRDMWTNSWKGRKQGEFSGRLKDICL